MAYSGQGSQFFWSTSTSASTSTTAAVGEIVSISGPGGDANVIDVTNLDSTAKESLIGLADPGEVTLTCNHAPANAGQQNLIADAGTRTLRKGVIRLTDAASYFIIFDAYCMGQPTISLGVDDKVTAAFRLRLAGGATYTTTMS